MSSNQQFPPSSPLRDSDTYASPDPFAGSSAPYNHELKKSYFSESRGRSDYPTPNPSSSLYRSSSPAVEVEEAVPGSSKKVSFDLKKVAINSDFNILNPDSNVLRIPLSSTQNQLAIGRSSKACDYFFGSNDRNVSRTHASISYSSEQIVLTCLGRNGLAVRIPKACHIIETSSKNNFIILENKSGYPLDLNLLGLKKSHKSIRLDADHTEFTLRNQETVTLPRFSNVLLEISTHILLLNPLDLDEELTDEEVPTLNEIKQDTEIKPIELPIATPIKSVPDVSPQTPLKDKSKAVLEDSKDETTPSKASVIPDFKVPSFDLIPTPKKFHIFEDKVAHSQPQSPVKRSSTPLNDKSNIMSLPSTPNRKASSEEPPKKKKKMTVVKTEVDNSCLDDVENMEEIHNIVINHLSFSRLSSTPASFLKTISVLTSNLSLKQIRTILHNIKCVGVIHRQGKDAAGKPLEEEYYYMPENDTDGSRTKLVASIKGHGGLRSCRRTHKQYYWKKPAAIKK